MKEEHGDILIGIFPFQSAPQSSGLLKKTQRLDKLHIFRIHGVTPKTTLVIPEAIDGLRANLHDEVLRPTGFDEEQEGSWRKLSHHGLDKIKSCPVRGE